MAHRITDAHKRAILDELTAIFRMRLARELGELTLRPGMIMQYDHSFCAVVGNEVDTHKVKIVRVVSERNH